MPRKIPTNNDLERGKRLLEVRKKIWGSRDKFSESTEIPAGSLEGWEKKGIDISNKCLAAVVKYGGDVGYILTGEKSAAVAHDHPQAAEEKLTSSQHEVLEGCNLIIYKMLEVQKEAILNPDKASKVAPLIRSLREGCGKGA